jgi:abortive infection bacteriophage resistance protein
LGFLAFQDKHNIRALLENIKFICTRCETRQKFSPKALTVLPVSKATTNKFDIFRQRMYIVYIWGNFMIQSQEVNDKIVSSDNYTIFLLQLIH